MKSPPAEGHAFRGFFVEEQAMAFQSLSDLKTVLAVSGSSDDPLLQSLQTTAEAAVEAHCRRNFTGGTFTEFFAGGSHLVFLRNYPVAAITEIRVDVDRVFGAETVQEATSYHLLADRGVIQCRRGRFVVGASPNQYPGAVKVVYTTATGQVPAPVAHASAELVGHWYRQAKTHAQRNHLNTLQETYAGTVTQYPWGQSGGFRWPAGVLQLLEPYRAISI
jgi:uncharacterized phiE125 gp8 family phage protein